MEHRTLIASTLIGIILFSTLAGCLDSEEDENVIIIAFKTQDDYDNPEANPQLLADYLAEKSGYTFELYPIGLSLIHISEPTRRS